MNYCVSPIAWSVLISALTGGFHVAFLLADEPAATTSAAAEKPLQLLFISPVIHAVAVIVPTPVIGAAEQVGTFEQPTRVSVGSDPFNGETLDSDVNLSGGTTPDKLEVGLFAKTWDSNMGGAANIDFAYFGAAQPPETQSSATASSSVDSATAVAASRKVDVAALQPFCVSGKELNVLNGYRETELLRHSGKGCLTHMWFGGDWPGYDRTRIRIYVDGAQKPSIDMELGLGHGCGFGDDAAPWGGAKLGKTGHPSGFYNTYKIPFGKEIRVTAQRAKDSPDGAPFWWIVRGTENLPLQLAGVRLPGHARLKLHKLSGHVAKPLEEFAFCDVKGAGALYQVTMAADGLRDTGDWKDISYLEAIVRAYINGRPQALQLSSGLEDYFLGTYYFNRGCPSPAILYNPFGWWDRQVGPPKWGI